MRIETVQPRIAGLSLALLLGNVALATGPLLVRHAGVGPVAAGFWRLALAIPFLLLLALRCAAAGPLAARGDGRRDRCSAAFFFAADLAAWHAGILLTKLGNATLFGNISSFLFAAWGLWLVRKWPSCDPGDRADPRRRRLRLADGRKRRTVGLASCAATCSPRSPACSTPAI